MAVCNLISEFDKTLQLKRVEGLINLIISGVVAYLKMLNYVIMFLKGYPLEAKTAPKN